MITKKEDLFDKYINLSNTKLNGKITSEIFYELKKCFKDMGFEFLGFDLHNYLGYIRMCYTTDYIYPTLCHARDKSHAIHEISIFDIYGMKNNINK